MRKARVELAARQLQAGIDPGPDLELLVAAWKMIAEERANEIQHLQALILKAARLDATRGHILLRRELRTDDDWPHQRVAWPS